MKSCNSYKNLLHIRTVVCRSFSECIIIVNYFISVLQYFIVCCHFYLICHARGNFFKLNVIYACSHCSFFLIKFCYNKVLKYLQKTFRIFEALNEYSFSCRNLIINQSLKYFARHTRNMSVGVFKNMHSQLRDVDGKQNCNIATSCSYYKRNISSSWPTVEFLSQKANFFNSYKPINFWL